MRTVSLRRAFVAMLAIAVMLATLGVAPASAAVAFTEKRLTSAPTFDKWDVDVWGNTVVWADDRNYGGNTGNLDIYMYDLVTGIETRISNETTEQDSPSVYGDVIVWEDRRHGSADIYMYDISTGVETRITDDPAHQQDPDIFGNTIVWEDKRHDMGSNRWEIYMYDLLTGTETRLTNVDSNKEDPKIHGDRIVFQDDRGGGDDNIFVYDLATGATTRLDADNANSQDDPRIWGDIVVWEDERGPGNDNVYMHDLSTGITRPITNLGTDQDDCDVYGDFIVWEDSRDGIDSEEVYAYNIATGTEERLTNSSGGAWDPRIWGNRVVWEDDRHSGSYVTEIYAGTFPVMPTRAAGSNRYGTSAAISQSHVGSAKTVIVATGADFADALSASGLAGAYGAPLILTAPDALSPEAAAEIARLDAQDAIIVGGTAAVSGAVESALNTAGLAVRRIGGANRFDTSRLIALEIKARTGATFGQAAFIVRGDGFADALSVSPAAYYEKMPVLLVQPGSLPAETLSALTALDIETGVVAGGTAAVGTAVKNAVDARLAANGGAASARWAGADRYETSVMVADGAVDRGWASLAFVGLAVGNNFPDALSGGVIAGREYGVLVMTDGSALSGAAGAYLALNKSDIGMLEAFGGPAVMSESVLGDLGALIN